MPFNDAKGQDNQNARLFKELVVRGKARQNLEGWDCSDCKNVRYLPSVL